MQKIHYIVLIFLLSSFIQPTESNECFYAWAEKGQSNVETCKKSSDCSGQNSKCIFSPITSSYICCQTKQGAIVPKCPNNDIVDDGGPSLCDKAENSNNNEQCPEGYECVESLTKFDKHPKQTSNHICCKK